MRPYHILELYVTLVVTTGCAIQHNASYTNVPITQDLVSRAEHEYHASNRLQYLSCDYKGWCAKLRKRDKTCTGNSYGRDQNDKRLSSSSMHAQSSKHLVAAEQSFVYAIMSNNVYRDSNAKPIFTLPDWELDERLDYASGLVLERLFRKDGNGHVIEIAIAFKGTDFDSGIDWKNNLAVFEPPQYKQAQDYTEKSLLRYGSIPHTVTGHSLGGGIALNVALRQSTDQNPIKVVAFNASPRAFFGDYNIYAPGEKFLIEEKGDILWLFRKLRGLTFSKLSSSRFVFNFLDFTTPTKNVDEHGIYPLSRALLLVAVGVDNQYAKSVFQANFDFEALKSKITDIKNISQAQKQYDLKRCNDLLNVS